MRRDPAENEFLPKGRRPGGDLMIIMRKPYDYPEETYHSLVSSNFSIIG